MAHLLWTDLSGEVTSKYSIIKSGYVLLELHFRPRCETKDTF